MAEQSLDLRSVATIVRRHRRVVLGVAAVGLVAGVAFAIVRPPLYSSSSMVLLPPQTENSSGQITSRDVGTDVRIAGSAAVLGRAGRTLEPGISLQALSQRVSISAPTADVIAIKASAKTPGAAEALARGVAQQDVAYLAQSANTLSGATLTSLSARNRTLQASASAVAREIKATSARIVLESPASPDGKADARALAQLTAQQANLVLQQDAVKQQLGGSSSATGSSSGPGATVLQEASPAQRAGTTDRMMLFAAIGLVAGALLASLVLALIGRRDRRLRSRDDIADALGSPVVASVRSRVPRGVAGWGSLLVDYTPSSADGWSLRLALRQILYTESPTGASPVQPEGPTSVSVLVLSDDLRALSMAPLLASYAVSAGLTTRFVADQGHESAAALWAACANFEGYRGQSGDGMVRPGLLVGPETSKGSRADLTLIVSVLDRRKPALLPSTPTDTTVLALSAGSADAEELARAAFAADATGAPIQQIVVVDPDDLDRTTGRLVQHQRRRQPPLPTRLTGPTSLQQRRSPS